MGVGFKKVAGTGEIPVWQHDRGLQLAQGGFSLDRTDFADGDVIKAGTPMIFSESTRTAKPLLTAVLNANATNTATTYQVNKGHNLKVGKYLATASGGAAYQITAIDTSNAAYDIITVGTTLGVALTAGAFLFGSSATGPSAASYGGVNGLLYTDCRVADGESVSIVIRGTIYARRVPYSSNLDGQLKASGAYIIYSQSY